MTNRHLGAALTTALFTGLASITPVAIAATDKAGEETLCAQAAYSMGLRYQQQSAEVEALQRQAFDLATYRLKEAIASHGEDANLAIITDLDEAVLDNSALLARDMAACHDYTTWDTWKHWEREGNPRLIPGAKNFLDFADEQGVAIYYISDRYQENKEASMATLTSLELPQVDDSHVLLLGPPKAERRASVVNDHTLVMQLGDSLPDFSGDFADADLAQQHDLVEKNADRFGKDWIVLPNAAYGDWDEAELKTWDAPLDVK